MDRERGVEANFERIFAQKPRADRMERAGPGKGVCHHTGLRAQHLGRDALDTALHLRRGAAREGEQHHAARVDARHDEMRHAVRQRVGFAGAGACNDQQRCYLFEVTASVFDGAALVGIESGEIRRGPRGQERRQHRLRLSKPLDGAAFFALASTRPLVVQSMNNL